MGLIHGFGDPGASESPESRRPWRVQKPINTTEVLPFEILKLKEKELLCRDCREAHEGLLLWMALSWTVAIALI